MLRLLCVLDGEGSWIRFGSKLRVGHSMSSWQVQISSKFVAEGPCQRHGAGLFFDFAAVRSDSQKE